MILIVLAGIGAGAINSLVGSGTLITFPTLVTLRISAGDRDDVQRDRPGGRGVSGTWGYRAELSGQWDRLRWQIPASLTGAAIGAFLLLHLPEKVFTRVVPVLLVLALILVVIGPRIQAYARRRAEEAGRSAEHVARADGGVGVRHVRGGGVWRLLHRGAGHPAHRGDGGVAAGGHPADERGEEPVVAVGQRGGRGGLRWWRSIGSAGPRPG